MRMNLNLIVWISHKICFFWQESMHMILPVKLVQQYDKQGLME